MKTFPFILALLLFISIHPYSSGQIVRGSVPEEIYVNCFWYFSPNTVPPERWGIFHSWDNGQTLSVQCKKNFGLFLRGDSMPGVVYLAYGTSIFRSSDYGISWDTIPTTSGNGFVSGCIAGEIYKHSADSSYPGLYRSTDFGDTFYSVNFSFISNQVMDVGTVSGEVYGHSSLTEPIDTVKLKYSNDYGATFSIIVPDTNVLPLWAIAAEPIISRGTLPGEFYLILMDTMARYRIFHTFNNGVSFEYNYITNPCLDCINNDFEFTFTAGRTAGSFYISKAVVDPISQNHTILCIDYSEDYGKTYTTNCFDLDSTFTGIGNLAPLIRNGLKQNYPNPFTDQTRIEFYLEKPGYAGITVFDIWGSPVSRLVSGRFTAGTQQITWDGRNDSGRKLPGGIYYYRLTVDGVPAGVKKAVIL